MQFLLLDAARMDNAMDKARELNPDLGHQSLYRSKISTDEVLPVVAPYLFTFPHSQDFSIFILNEGWGNSWGVFIDSEFSFDILYNHLRRFLLVKTEDGKELYFRFYDPRVLRVFLPTCDRSQLEEFFGPVDRYIMEDEDPERVVIFSLDNGVLKTINESKDALL